MWCCFFDEGNLHPVSAHYPIIKFNVVGYKSYQFLEDDYFSKWYVTKEKRSCFDGYQADL